MRGAKEHAEAKERAEAKEHAEAKERAEAEKKPAGTACKRSGPAVFFEVLILDKELHF